MPDIRVTPTSARVFTFENPVEPGPFFYLSSGIAALSGGGFVRSDAGLQSQTGGARYTERWRLYDDSNTSVRTGGAGKSGADFRSPPEQDIASLPNGGFVIVVHQDFNADVFQTGRNIYLQTFAADGTSAGAAISVSGEIAGEQLQPEVAVLQSGGFGVAWRDNTPLAAGDTGNIRFQLLDSAKQKIGGQILVNSTIAGLQSDPSIAALDDQRFLVAWQDPSGTLARLLDSSGAPASAEIRVSFSTGAVEVVALSSGGFVVRYGDKAQIFDLTGAKVGGELTITGAQNLARLDGGFIVAEQVGLNLMGQVFADDGTPIGDAFFVYDYSGHGLATGLADGTLQFVWQEPWTEGVRNPGRSVQQFGWVTAYGGTAGNDALAGSLGDDTFTPGAGADTVRGFAGSDTVSYADLATAMLITLRGEWSSDGTSQDTFLEIENATGSSAADVIYGGLGDNALDGSGGADILIGYAGNDSFYVDDAADYEIEAAGGGTDTVYASVSYALPGGQEIEALSARDAAATDPLMLVGNALAQTITGNAGANLIIGAGGGDIMQGLGGDDVYRIYAAADSVVEAAGGGTDVIYTGIDYTLAVNVEILIAVQDSTDPLRLNSSIGGILIGNGGDNIFEGNPAIASGGAGDDRYFVTSDSRIIEADGEGTDIAIILSTGVAPGSPVQFHLEAGSYVETLVPEFLIGTRAYDIFGNETDNVVYGNDGANTLGGGGGSDILIGRAGDDILDTGDGDDQLNGGAGDDMLTGGNGADLFVFSDAGTGDTITDFEGGVDRIKLAALIDQSDFAFIGSATFTSHAGEVRFAGGELQGDIDGDGSADFVVAVQGDAITGADFYFGP